MAYELKFKKTGPDAVLPTKATEGSAGLDLYSTEEAVIMPHTSVHVHSELAVAIPDGYFGAIFPRSGLASIKGIRLANSVGVIDSDYRGAMLLPLYNDSDKMYRVHKGDRVAQLVIIPCLSCEPVEVGELDETDRGSKGLGSSGK